MKGLTLPVVLQALLLFCIVYSAALLVPVLFLKYAILKLIGFGIFYFLLAISLVLLDGGVLLVMLILCTGMAARLLNLKYSGDHDLDLRNKEVKKWLLSLSIYLPTAVVLDLFHLYPLKSLHIKLFGGKIGNNVIMGGMITDPALLEVGDHTVIGGFSTILGHSVEYGRITFSPVRIGANCGVGTRATILAGAVMEDGSLLAAHSLLPKACRIPAGRTYRGVPARGFTPKSERIDGEFE